MKIFTQKFIGLLTLVFTICFTVNSQDLGTYYTSNTSAKTNGLTFKIKKPLGYTQLQGEIETTIVGFANNNRGGVVSEFYISIYSLKEMDLLEFKNMSKNEIKDTFLSNNIKYYELCGYPGWIAEESIVGGLHYNHSPLLMEAYLFLS